VPKHNALSLWILKICTRDRYYFLKLILQIKQISIFLTDRSVKINMSPKSENKNIEIRKNKRALIMQTALELFANEGLNTPISLIAKKAGISKGLIYNYFESKDDLLCEIVSQKIKEIFNLLDPNNDGVLTDEEFLYFIEEGFNNISNNLDTWRLYFIIATQKKAQEIIASEVGVKMPMFMQVLENYFKTKKSNDPTADAMFFISAIDGAFFDVVLSPKYFNSEKLKQKIVETFITKYNE